MRIFRLGGFKIFVNDGTEIKILILTEIEKGKIVIKELSLYTIEGLGEFVEWRSVFTIDGDLGILNKKVLIIPNNGKAILEGEGKRIEIKRDLAGEILSYIEEELDLDKAKAIVEEVWGRV